MVPLLAQHFHIHQLAIITYIQFILLTQLVPIPWIGLGLPYLSDSQSLNVVLFYHIQLWYRDKHMVFINDERELLLGGFDWLDSCEKLWRAFGVVVYYDELVACLNEDYVRMV